MKQVTFKSDITKHCSLISQFGFVPQFKTHSKDLLHILVVIINPSMTTNDH